MGANFAPTAIDAVGVTWHSAGCEEHAPDQDENVWWVELGVAVKVIGIPGATENVQSSVQVGPVLEVTVPLPCTVT